MLYGSDPLTPTSLEIAIDDDTLSDSELSHTTEQVSYLVLEVNANPNARSDSRSTTQGISVEINVLANDGDTLSLQSVTQGSNGSVGISSGSSVTCTPNASFVGSDSFSSIVSDGNGGENTGQVSVSILDEPHRPHSIPLLASGHDTEQPAYAARCDDCAESQIRDTDLPGETADHVRLQVQQNVATAVPAITHQDAYRLLVLMDLGPCTGFQGSVVTAFNGKPKATAFRVKPDSDEFLRPAVPELVGQSLA